MQELRERAPAARVPVMTETRFEEMKRYTRFDAADEQALLAFVPLAAPHFVRIAREFYERTREHADAHAVFKGEEQIERLERSMVRWMGRMLGGPHDEAYFEETQKIGRVHVRVGLPERYMFTAMALIRVSLEAVADQTLGLEAARTRSALSRILDLDLAIMVESYREDLTAQVRRRDDVEAQSLRTDLTRTVGLYEAALDSVPSIVIGVDRQGAVRLFNRAARLITGYALEDVFGASFTDTFIPEDARPKDVPLFEALLSGPEARLGEETVLKTRSGRFRDVRWYFTRVADGRPGDVVLFAIGSDVTESRAASRQLHQNEKLAALGTLAAGLAHEIRNPLNGAQLHVSFLQRALQNRLPDPELLEAAGVVGEEIKRLARLVSEFLDFARPVALVKKQVAIQALLAGVLELTTSEVADDSITIDVDVPPQDLFVFGDAAKLEQVLLNVVHNAIEALRPRAAGRIILRARRNPRHVRVEVEDDGPGLSSPDAPVFDAFFSTKPTGTGLGLAIAHRIVTDHGGAMGVESRPGRTCFAFTIPVGTDSTTLGEEGP